MIVRNYPITTDNVRNVGGKDMILTRMVNHYSALSKAKPVVDDKSFLFIFFLLFSITFSIIR